jgi:hypothetical protein
MEYLSTVLSIIRQAAGRIAVPRVGRTLLSAAFDLGFAFAFDLVFALLSNVLGGFTAKSSPLTGSPLCHHEERMRSTYTVAEYLTDLRAIRSTGSATAETSFYPPVDRLFNTAGQKLKPAILFSTQLRNQGAGMPDGGFFPQPASKRPKAEPPILQNPERGVVEIKPADYNLDTLTNEPQTLRYLKQYGLVLITNLREFRLLQLTSAGTIQTLERYTLAASPAALWDDPIARFARHADLLPDFLARVMLYRAPLVQPKDVAWLLASYAREARARAEDHPLGSFRTVKLALQESLGIQFEREKGEHFFRSTLVQTLFYGIFSAWILWRRVPENRAPGARFDWRVSAHYLRVPVLLSEATRF